MPVALPRLSAGMSDRVTTLRGMNKNASETERETLRYLRPALDSLPWIQRNRRIFFLGSWINAFVQGRRDPLALEVVQRFLSETRDLPRDIREKVLQASDELERTIRIRRTFGAVP